MRHYKNYNLKKYNSFGIESIAKQIWFPETIDELIKLIKKLKGKKFEILAGGTNVLLNKTIDRVICLKNLKQIFIETKIRDLFLVSANYPLNKFIDNIINKQLTGVEGLIGIPGTVGGALIMNSGSGGYCISDYLEALITIDLKGTLKHYQKKDLKFKRRYSILQDKKEILIAASFTFKNLGLDFKLIEKTEKYRKEFPKGHSAGGIFINHYTLRPYEKEIRLIKSRNLVISKYPNIIINKGNATAKEVLEFINKIRSIVKEPLELEIKLLGF